MARKGPLLNAGSASHPELIPITACVSCGGATRPTHGELRFQRDDLMVTVQDVPMSVCDQCGERYVPGPVGVALGDQVDSFIQFCLAEAAQSGAVAHPRSLVMKASQQVSLLTSA